MDMAKETFLNFRISDEERDALDEAAKRSGCDRSKQARALIRFALGIEDQKPYIPIARQEQLSFSRPTQHTPGRRSRSGRRRAA